MRLLNRVGLNYAQTNEVIDYANGIFVMKTGNDTNDGSYASPFLTLDKANTAATAGKKIYVYAGEYVEDNATEHCWVVSKATTWRAIGNVTVKATSGNYALVVKIANGSVVEGFTIDPESKIYTVSLASNNNTLKRCTILKGKNSVRFESGSTGNVIDNCVVDGNSGASTVIYAVGGGTVQNCTFKNCSAPSLLYSFNHISPISFVNNVAISGITCSGNILYLRGDSVYTVTGNTITLAGNCVSLVYLYDSHTAGSVTIENNTFETSYLTSAPAINFSEPSQSVPVTFANNSVKCLNASQSLELVKIADKSDVVINSNYFESVANPVTTINIISSGTNTLDTIVKNNYIVNPSLSGYIIKVGTEATGANDNKCDGAIIENNWIYGKRYTTPSQVTYDVHCIFVGHNRAAQIRYNHVYGGGLAIIIKSSGTTDPTAVIMYNVITNAKQAIRLKGVPDVTIVQNTIYANGIDGHAGIYLDDNVGSDHSSGVTLKNNIIYTTSTVLNNILVFVKTGSETDLHMDYNCLKADGAASYGAIAGTTYATHALLTAAGFNENGINDNPLFVSTAAYDFTLETNSPCLDSGETLAAALDDGQDYTNASLSDVMTKQQAGIWDVGAYVY